MPCTFSKTAKTSLLRLLPLLALSGVNLSPLPKSCYGSCMSAHCLLYLCFACLLLPGHPSVCSGCTRSVARDGERLSLQLSGAAPGHAYSSLRLPLILQAAPVPVPSSSGVSAVPSIYLGQELSPRGDFAVSCKKGTFLLQPGKSFTESDHRRQGFNSRGHEF